jgi:hypothetical protein
MGNKWNCACGVDYNRYFAYLELSHAYDEPKRMKV